MNLVIQKKIRLSCKIGNWQTALKHCLELLLQEKIAGQRTSRGWIFWVNGVRDVEG